MTTKVRKPVDVNKPPSGDNRIGTNLHNILGYLDMSQSDFANRSGLTQAAVSQIINGEREPSLGTIQKILSVLPITFERLTR